MLTIINSLSKPERVRSKIPVNTWYVHVFELPHWSVCDFGVWHRSDALEKALLQPSCSHT